VNGKVLGQIFVSLGRVERLLFRALYKTKLAFLHLQVGIFIHDFDDFWLFAEEILW
jgi:hypothetical protein